MSEADNAATQRRDAQGSLGPGSASESTGGYLSSWLNSGTAASTAWGLWESVKNNPKVVEAQQHAQQAWNDSDAVRARLVELGNSATDYIDEADRLLETLELGAVNYLHQRSTEIVEKVRQAATGPEREGEVLFSGPERTPVSRLDAELQLLHTSPDRIRAKTDAPAARVSAADTAERLSQSPELAKLHAQMSAELGEDEFWNRYIALREDLEQQDRRRKMLIESQNEDKFEGWGSSDEETDEQPAASSTGSKEASTGSKEASTDPKAASTDSKAASAGSKAAYGSTDAAKPREPIDEEASDLDWE